MRRVFLAAAAAAHLGCSVPGVHFYADPADAADATMGSDDGAVGGDLDGTTATGPDGSASDSGVTGDGAEGGGEVLYCAGDVLPAGAKCCGDGGPVCYGTCNKNSCSACGPCALPMVCCTKGATGSCETAPCKHDAGIDDGGSDAGDAATDS